MVSRTVSLENSAYEKLRAAKLPGESFSETVNRLVASSAPTFRVLAGFLTASEADAVRKSIQRMRGLEAPAERQRLRAIARSHGPDSRH